MTDLSTLRDLLDQVDPPAHGGYSTVVVPAGGDYRIGRGEDGAVVLLTPPDSEPDPPTRLRLIRLDPRVTCRVEGPRGVVHLGEYGVVEFRPDERGMVEPFLAVGAALIRLLGPDPAPGQVSRGMRRLVRLFEQSRGGRGSVLGLWGELLLIATSSNPARLVDAWHVHMDDRFDFAEQGSRLEVKTTTRDRRVHRFGLGQLLPVDDTTTRVASIVTTEIDTGTPVADLVARVEKAVASSPDRQMKVHEQVSEVLGPDWSRFADRRFDEAQATASLRLLDAAGIPRVEVHSPEILEVDLTVDCTDLPPSRSPAGLAAAVAMTPEPQPR